MDFFEFNKIAGAVLGTALGVMALSIISDIIFEPAEAEQPGMIVAGVEPGAEAGGGGGTAAVEVAPIAVRLAAADVAAGEKSTGKCRSCHVFAEGDMKKMPGPNLYGIVGASMAHLEGFGYSDALMAKRAEGQTWTFDNLDNFLTAPRTFVPGTAMTFAGLKNPDERANVIAYLRTLSPNPVPLPEASTAAAAEGATAPAETGAAAPEAPADAQGAAPAGQTAQPPASAEPQPAPAPAAPAVQAPPAAEPAPVPPAEPAPTPAPAQ